MRTFMFTGPHGCALTVSSPVWFDARRVACQMMMLGPEDVTWEEEKTGEFATVEAKYEGHDFGRVPGRGFFVREWDNGKWTDWRAWP